MDEDLQVSAPETAEIPDPEAKAPDAGASGAPENVETDEEKNRRVQAEAEAASKQRAERKQQRIQQRFDELTAEKYAANKRADELAAALNKIVGERSAPAPAQSGEPTREQFDSYEDFVTARAEYRAEVKAQAAAKAAIEQFTQGQKEQQTRQSLETEREQVAREFLQRRAQVEKSIPDYREVVEDWDPNIPETVSDLITRMPEGPLIAYHLAKNPDLERQFQSAPQYMHGVLLGQIVATLKASAKTTAAPAPGKPVSSKTAPSDGEYSGPVDGYYAWAKKNLR